MLRRAVTADGGLLVLRFGEQLGHADAESLAQLLQLVVGQGQPVVLDLGQGRDRNPAALAHFLERPAIVRAQRLEEPAQRRVVRILVNSCHANPVFDNFPIRSLWS